MICVYTLFASNASGQVDNFGYRCIYKYMTDLEHMAHQIASECPAIRVREASRLLTRAYDAALRPVGLQFSQLSILVAVSVFGDHGGAMGPLADRLAMDRTTLTRNLKPLERAGLVEVARAPGDART